MAAVLVAVLLLAAGCGGGATTQGDPGAGSTSPPPAADPGPDQPAPARGGTITIATRSATTPDPNPNLNATIANYVASELVAEPLVRWEDGDYIGLLAEAWDSPDGQTWTFRLRPGVTFQNGVPLTADAVKATFDLITNPDDPLPTASNLTDIESFEILSDLEFRLQLAAVNPEFLLNLARVYIVEPGSAQEGQPVGTGPFRVVDHIPDQHLTFEKYPDYWGGEPALDEIVMRAIPDGDTLVLELESGTVDLILFVPSNDVKRLEAAGFKAMPFVRVNTARVAFNLATTDVRLRQAACYALDRDIIIQNAVAGYGVPQLTAAVQGSWAFNDEVEPFHYDPDRARAILDEAGWVDTDGDGIREINGRPIDLHLPSRGDDQDWLSATQIIQQMLLEVGIGSHITTAERLTYYDSLRAGEFDLTWWITNALPEPPIYDLYLHSSAYWNISQVAIPELDDLLEKGRSVMDRDQRAGYYKAAQAVHLEHVMECPIMWIQQIHVANPDLQNLKVEPTGVMYNAHRWALGN